MSRGSIFVSPTTQHYCHLPHLEGYGFSYIDAYSFNVLANRRNPIASRAKDITNHKDVYIYAWNDESETGFVGWLASQLGVTSDLSYYQMNVSGDLQKNIISWADMFGQLDIAMLINYVESTSYDQRARNYHSGNLIARTLHDIQTSMDGYLIGAKNSKIFFPQPYANKTARTAALKGSTLFSAVPRRASGEKYHYRGSENEETGVYIGGKKGLSNEDHAATVAGNMKMKWNPAQKVWEAGGTFLAVLLTDVEGANIQKPGITLDNIQGRTSEEFFKSDAVERMSEFTTGSAMPINLHSAHPKAFGPNINKCGADTQVEIIRVVNRGKTNFSSGERVLVNQIDGENIITKYTEETLEQRSPQPGRWNFTKFMANSDEYFRYGFGDEFPTEGRFEGRPPITPETAAQLMYAKYYNSYETQFDLINDFLDTIGMGTSKITKEEHEINRLSQAATGLTRTQISNVKLFEYWQHASVDMMWDGGEKNEFPLFGGTHHRINIEVDPTGRDQVGQENVLGVDMPLWFGPMFPDGQLNASTWKTYTFDKMQTPADFTYPYFHYAHQSIKDLNSTPMTLRGVPTSITTSGIKQVNNQSRVQFSFLQPDLMACGDKATEQLPKTGGDQGRFGSFNTRARRFIDSASEAADKAYGGGKFVINSQPANNVSQYVLDEMFLRRSSGLDAGRVAIKFNNPFGPGRMANMYRNFVVPGNLQYTFPYDCYIDYVPLNTAKNAPGLFGGDTGPESSTAGLAGGVSVNSYVGSNAVGITSARFRMNQGTGTSWSLAAETNQTFGMKGRFFGGGGGGGIVATIIGSIMAFSSDTRGRTIQGSVPMWGSQKGDSIDSFGTGACHIQVWDAWPDEFTHWVPQYMFALHFNPRPLDGENPQAIPEETDIETGEVITKAQPLNYVAMVSNYRDATKKSNGEWDKEPEDLAIQVGFPTDLTYTEPMYGSQKVIKFVNSDGNIVSGIYPQYEDGIDGTYVPIGDVINNAEYADGTKQTYLRPTNTWYNNRKREGKLVSLYGYHYWRNVLGLNDGKLTSIEEGFQTGDEQKYTVGRGDKQATIIIKNNTLDNNDSIEIARSTWASNDGNTYSEQQRGAGYLPSELPISFNINDPNGKTAVVVFDNLKCYAKHYHDQGPKPRSSLQRISKASGEGTDTVVGNKGVGVAVTGNKTGSTAMYPDRSGDISFYPAQYEVFVYVHNDVQFTWIREPEATTGYQFAQYITLSLG